MKSSIEQAAQWFARLQQAPDDEDLRARFERWLWAHAAHAQAYLAVCEVWDDCDSAPRLRHLADAATRDGARRQQRRRLLKQTTLGTLAVLAAGSGVFWQRHAPWRAEWRTARTERLGEQTLPDGSSMMLSPDAVVQARFRPDERLLELERGALILRAAKASGSALFLRSDALGLRTDDAMLAVDRWHAGHLRISVDSGQVDVINHKTTWLGWQRKPAAHWQVDAGQVLELTDGRARLLDVPATDAFSWRTGVLTFSGATLTELGVQLSRYHDIPVDAPEGDGPAHAPPRIAASVRLADIDTFLAQLPALAPVKVRAIDGRIHLLPA